MIDGWVTIVCSSQKAPTDLDQPPSSEAQAVATGAGELQSSEQSQVSILYMCIFLCVHEKST